MSYKQKLIKYLIVINCCLIVIGLSSCGKTPLCDCFDSAGKDASQVREVLFFNQIVVKDNINVYITTGNPEQVTIEGGGNLLQNIGTTVSNGVLTLKNNNI